MGLTLQGAGALAGGTVQGFQNQRKDNREQAGENRLAESRGWLKDQGDAAKEGASYWKPLMDAYGKREMIESPDAWMQYGLDATLQGVQQYSQPQPAIMPEMQPQQGIQAPSVFNQPMQGAAEGGPVGVPPQQQAVQAPQALPTGPQAPQAPQQQAPQAPGQPQAKTPTRRERYNQWYGDTARLATLTGGLEGYQKFQEMENATARKQVMGYGLQAIRSMDEGNVGEAMRAGNSALESTPFDTGLKFVAEEGQLRMVGKDGKPGKPLSARHLQAFVDDHMKTPAQYLDWKKQAETERSALVTEGQKDTELGIDDRRVKTSESQERRLNRYAERGMQVEEAKALASLITAKASSTRASKAIEDAAFNGWKTTELQKIISTSQSYSLEHITELNEDVGDYYREHPLAWNNVKSDLQYLQMAQSPQEMITPEDAVIVSQLIRQPAGITGEIAGMTEGAFTVDLLDDGTLVAMKEGRPIRLTPELETIYMQKNPEQAKQITEARKGLGTNGALPAEEEPAPGPAPQWQEDAIRMGEEDKRKEQQAAMQTQQEQERYVASSH